MQTELTPSSGMVTIGRPWAEEIKAYEAAKSVLPWLPEQQTPVKYITRHEKSRQEREYDLVLGKFRDAERELSKQREEHSKQIHSLEQARAKQLRNLQRFDIVNHSPAYPGANDPHDRLPSPHPNRKKNAAGYNIITNLASEPNCPIATPARSASRRPIREFNILTNKYHDRHEDRVESEAASAKQQAAQKFFRTHDFDPVRISFFDGEKEDTFLRAREEAQQVHGKDRVLKLPPREQFSEGRLYNIVNQSVINPEKLASASKHGQRALNKIQKTTFERRMRAEGELRQERDNELCLNRYAHERNTQAYVHGYDPVTNESFIGRDSKPTMPTRTHARLHAWKVLEDGLPAGTKTTGLLSPAKNSKQMAKPNTSTRQRVDRNQDGERSNILVIRDDSGARVRTGGFS